MCARKLKYPVSHTVPTEHQDSFVDGSCKISDGEIFDETTSDTVCIISDELAAYNEVSVGDTITLVNPNNEEETYSFTVTGIYTNSESAVMAHKPAVFAVICK